jgi:hypothetical protein
VSKIVELLGRYPRTAIGLAMLVSSVAVYVPFLGSMDKVCRYWDGPPYMYVAKTLYDVPEDHPFVPYGLPRSYFANHLPAYPLLIRALSLVTLASYPAAMLLATLVTSIAAAILFYELLVRWGLVQSPLWTALHFCVLPPRWVIYHAVGATEPLFFCCVFAALLALRAERPGLVTLFSLLASLTRITGALLPVVFLLIYAQRREWRRAAAMPLAGLGLVALFAWYRVVYGDFFAYFTWSMDEAGMISLEPFEIFRRYAGSEKLHSVELYAWMYILYGLGTLALWKRRELFTYSFLYFAFCTLITHQDLPRYLLAIAPFALLVAFDDVLARPACKAILPLVLYLDYTYVWRFLPSKLVSSGVYEKLLEALGH